jgi:hypothetical protein
MNLCNKKELCVRCTGNINKNLSNIVSTKRFWKKPSSGTLKVKIFESQITICFILFLDLRKPKLKTSDLTNAKS